MGAIEIQLDGKPVTKLQAARALSVPDTMPARVGEPDEDGYVNHGYVTVWARRHVSGELRPAEVSWISFGAVSARDARYLVATITLGAEIAELAEMIVAERDAAEKPVTWQCTYCWTEYEALPSDKPPVCPECGPLHGPGASAAQPRRKAEPAATPEERLMLAVYGVNPDNAGNVHELRRHAAECTEADHAGCLAHLPGQAPGTAT